MKAWCLTSNWTRRAHPSSMARRPVPGVHTARGIRLGGCAASPSGTRGRLPLAPPLRSGLRPAASGHMAAGDARPGYAGFPPPCRAGGQAAKAGSGEGSAFQRRGIDAATGSARSAASRKKKTERGLGQTRGEAREGVEERVTPGKSRDHSYAFGARYSTRHVGCSFIRPR